MKKIKNIISTIFIFSAFIFLYSDKIDNKIDMELKICMRKNKSTLGMLNCIYTAYRKWIRKININFKILLKKLKVHEQSVLIESQRLWKLFWKRELKAIEKSSFAEIWSNKGSGPPASSAVVSNNYVYFPTLGKYIYILNKVTGKILQEIKLEGRVRSTPLIKNGKLVIACEDDNINVFAISK